VYSCSEKKKSGQVSTCRIGPFPCESEARNIWRGHTGPMRMPNAYGMLSGTHEGKLSCMRPSLMTGDLTATWSERVKWTELVEEGWGCSSAHWNEPSGSIQGDIFLDHPSDHRFLELLVCQSVSWLASRLLTWSAS
jgi:hypothetical protein